MSNQTSPGNWVDGLRRDLRALRARYDALDRGGVAQLRRCRTATEIQLEGGYWGLVGSLGREVSNLEHVVLLFPLAGQARLKDFSFGRYLQRHLGEKAGAALRFRRLLACRDRDELGHRLRGVLRLVDAVHNPVDWGVLGPDILWYFADSDTVRRKWAQDFYAPAASTPTTSPELATQQKE